MIKGQSKWKNKLGTPTYNSWKSMRQRILFSNNDAHKTYKEKGITICNEWVDDYDKFYEDMGERPFGTTLDRIDGNGNYEPSNCRWASHRVQQNNKDFLTKVEKDGVIKTIGEWAFELELSDKELQRAYKRYQEYGASSFEEVFHDGSLRELRTASRNNICFICGSLESCSWKKDGKLCNTCYNRAYRWKAKTGNDIETFHEWKSIGWEDISNYARLNVDRLTK